MRKRWDILKRLWSLFRIRLAAKKQYNNLCSVVRWRKRNSVAPSIYNNESLVRPLRPVTRPRAKTKWRESFKRQSRPKSVREMLDEQNEMNFVRDIGNEDYTEKIVIPVEYFTIESDRTDSSSFLEDGLGKYGKREQLCQPIILSQLRRPSFVRKLKTGQQDVATVVPLTPRELKYRRASKSASQLYAVSEGLEAPMKKLMRKMLLKVGDDIEDEQQRDLILQYFSAMVIPHIYMSDHGSSSPEVLSENKVNMFTGKTVVRAIPDAPMGFICAREKEALEFYRGSKYEWNMDIFKLDDLVDGHTLVFLTKSVLETFEVFTHVNVDRATVLNFLCLLEANYKPNFYHSSLHAADVTHSMFLMLNTQNLAQLTTSLDKFALIIAAAAHDVGHPGFNNQYLINTRHPLAITYNDNSVLENHHAASTFRLINNRGCDFLRQLSSDEQKLFRRIVIASILNTDMARHANVIEHFSRSINSYLEVKHAPSNILRESILTTLVHCADLAGPTRALPIYRDWTNRVMQEMFFQGEEEYKLGLPISPMCNRDSVIVEKAQTGFIDVFVEPLWKHFCRLVQPEFEWIIPQVLSNRRWYAMQLQEPKTTKPIKTFRRLL